MGDSVPSFTNHHEQLRKLWLGPREGALFEVSRQGKFN